MDLPLHIRTRGDHHRTVIASDTGSKNSISTVLITCYYIRCVWLFSFCQVCPSPLVNRPLFCLSLSAPMLLCPGRIHLDADIVAQYLLCLEPDQRDFMKGTRGITLIVSQPWTQTKDQQKKQKFACDTIIGTRIDHRMRSMGGGRGKWIGSPSTSAGSKKCQKCEPRRDNAVYVSL